MSYRLSILGVALVAAALAGCQTATGRTAGAVVDDSRTTAAVKAKLVADRPANLAAVGVNTVNNTVYLTGVVDTPAQRVRAEQLAWEVADVRQVVNNIQVQRAASGGAPAATVGAPPAGSVPTRAVVGRVTSVDASRGQVTVATGTEDLLVQLPASVVRDIRPGDEITLDVGVRPGRR